jgi:DMSO/TMAO reductase YedYZ heme-binding membrane subunit
VSLGHDNITKRLLFTYIEPPTLLAEVTTLIHVALGFVVLFLLVNLFVSSRCAMIIRCGSHHERDYLYCPAHCA